MRRRLQALIAIALLGLSGAALEACTVQRVGELITPAASPGRPSADTPTPLAATPAIPPLTLPPTPDLAATASAAPAATATLAEYIVQPGDTLLELATRWDVPMAAIQKLNGMGDSTVVKVGLTLLIPSGAGWEGASRFWVLHVVREGETLSGIARRYGLEISRLMEVNHLTDPDHIVTGTELVLPLTGPVDAPPLPTPTPVRRTPTPKSADAPAGEYGPADVAAAATTAPPPPMAGQPGDIADWPRETVRIINELRAQYDLPPYAYSEILAMAAQAHAEDCAQRGWCSHTGSDGADIRTRVQRAGYTGVGWAECWAQRQSPQGAVDIWMDEVPPNDPHRRMMLHTWFTEVGVGIAKASWGYYFIADFGRP